MAGVQRGRLAGSEAAPATGEVVECVVIHGGITVEHILSGELDEPVAYDQDHDEWVVLLDGAADLEVEGEALSLTAGDWLLLPGRVPHRLVRTSKGTRWLAVHFRTG